MIVAIVICSALSTILISGIIYFIIPIIKMEKIKYKLTQTKTYGKLWGYVVLSDKRKLFPKRISKLNPFMLFLIMLGMLGISFVLFYSYLKIKSTAFILSLPFFLAPIIIIKILLNREKTQITRILPMYVVNIKNHISEDNNIITAMQRTIIEEPLRKYIDTFKTNVSRGMNVIEAFDKLKDAVNVKTFTVFINSCQVCYLNGGDFHKVLERYIEIITKENIHKESTKEKSYSDILTLMIMAALNVLVIVMFVLTNKEYAAIMRETFLGRMILNFNAISYIVIAYLISRIYKEE